VLHRPVEMAARSRHLRISVTAPVRAVPIVPKNKRPLEKVKGKGDDKIHNKANTAKEASSRDKLVAPLNWAQRLKRVFNMTGPPSDHFMPLVWWHHGVTATSI